MTETTISRVLIIAGSDSSGGAGIQADMKSCAAFGAYSMSAITAVTAQNTVGVQQVEVMPAELVRAQIRSCLSDIGADVIKIGMLGNTQIIDVIAEEIEDSDAFVILDPVMVATSGDSLLGAEAVAHLKTRLLPLADLVTPNVPEAELLTGIKIEDIDDMTKAGDALLEMNVYAALMKGGHLTGKSIFDVLVSKEGANIMSGPRIHSRHTHGTGCTLASAIAANMALGAPLEVAVTAAREFVFEAIRTAPKLGAGNGPLNHGLALGEDETAGDNNDTSPDANNPFAALKGLR
ncbi:MAG: bifunctional hydroxymethylpyrimidine kinase/phosphomethylpyrimidine kinase [Litorimonas sp.]